MDVNEHERLSKFKLKIKVKEQYSYWVFYTFASQFDYFRN